MTFKISNTSGKSGGNWAREYKTRHEAAHAIREAMGWDGVVLSPSFAADDTAAWCAYESQEYRDADQEGAYAPRIIRT